MLPKNYDGLHVRNTDVKSNYKDKIRSLDAESDLPLLICSDDHEVLKFAKETIRRRTLLTTSTPPNPKDYGASTVTIHKDAPFLPRWLVNTSAIADLFCLAFSNKLQSSKLLDKQCKDVSGYFQLAVALKASPRLLRRLVGV